MTATFFSRGALDTPGAFLVAGLVGLLFGFSLERAGFGSSRRLAGIFYLREMAVVQVMFSAIVTALVGLRLLAVAGLVDPFAIHRMETFLGPQIVGGLLFGAGFVIAGWCPGTALVGLSAGRLDALAFLGGAGAGSLVYAAMWPSLERFSTVGACGVATLPETFGLPVGVTVFLVVLMALGAFVAAERLQARADRAAR